jgi:phosphoribosylpyrophosphate synthetase
MAADIQASCGDLQLIVVSPDVGGVVRARALAKRLDNAPLAIARRASLRRSLSRSDGRVETPASCPERERQAAGATPEAGARRLLPD